MHSALNTRPKLRAYRNRGLALFADQQYQKKSTNELCKELSISKSDFEARFGSKEAFFTSIAHNLLSRKIMDLLIEPARYAQNPLTVILERITAELEEALQCHTTKGLAINELIKACNCSLEELEQRQDQLPDFIKLWEINLELLLEKGQQDGYIKKEVDTDKAAHYITTSYVGIRKLLVADQTPLLVDQYLQQLRYYFDSIKDWSTI